MLPVFAVLCLASLCAADDFLTNMGELPMQNPDLFQGDIIGIDPDDKNAIALPHLKWPGGIVPYVIDVALLPYKSLIEQAMQHYHQLTCIKFKPRTHEWNYIKLFFGEGCYSNVGMMGGQQMVSLGKGCGMKAIIIHELGHAIGFYHEQNRSDRDKYIVIYWKNIQKGAEQQFALLQPHQNLLLDTFDYNSIMLYGSTSFSKDGHSITMASITGQRLQDTHFKPGLSQSDIKRVKLLYNCP